MFAMAVAGLVEGEMGVEDEGTWGASGGLGKEEGLGAGEEEAGRQIREACAMV